MEGGFGLTSMYVTDSTGTSVATRKVATPKWEATIAKTDKIDPDSTPDLARPIPIEWVFALTSTYVTDVTGTSVATRKVATPRCEVGCCCTWVRF